MSRPLKKSRKLKYLLIACAGLLGVGVAANQLLSTPTTSRADILTQTIKLEPIDLTVVERGNLESVENKEVVCHVKATTKGATASTTIKWVIDDGTEVKANELIALLDSSALEDQYIAQKIVVDTALANFTTASENVKIVVSQNKSDQETALNTIQLAQIDLETYIGLPKETFKKLSRDKAEELLQEIETNPTTFSTKYMQTLSPGNPLLSLKGTYQQLLDDVNGRVDLAESDVESWKDRAAYSSRMALKGYISASQVSSDESRLSSSIESLKKVRTEKGILVNYTVHRSVKDYRNKIKEAWSAYDRTLIQANAKEIQATTERETKRSVYEQERKRLEEIENQIQMCKIVSPQEGMVVYFVPEQLRFGQGSNQSMIAQGEPVREGQKLMRIPNLRKMQVNTKIHEAMVSKLRADDRRPTGFVGSLQASLLLNLDPFSRLVSQNDSVIDNLRNKFANRETKLISRGQSASIRIDSFPDKLLKGHVRTVATVASQQDFFAADVKVYQTMIGVDEEIKGLKPGMSAEVTIHIENTTTPVRAIPIQAIFSTDGDLKTRKCFVMTPTGPQEREIVIGLSNDRLAEVKEGLDEGDTVVLNPSVLLKSKGKSAKTADSIDSADSKGGWGEKGKTKGKGGFKGKGGMPGGGMPGKGAFPGKS